MPSLYSTEQETYNRLLKTKLNLLVTEFFQVTPPAEHWQVVLDDKLSKSSSIISNVSTVMTAATLISPIAGPAGMVAVSAINTAIVVTGAIFVFAQTVSDSYKMVHRPDGSAHDLTEKEISLEEHQLLWTLRLEEIADILTQRHCHFLTKKINSDDIVFFAEVGAERIMKKIKETLIERKKQLAKLNQALTVQDVLSALDPEMLTTYLLDDSVHISSFHSVTKIRLKEAHESLSLFHSKAVEIPAKWGYGRSRIGYYQFNTAGVLLDFYKSDSESSLYRTDTSLPHCGYAILPTQGVLGSRITRNKRTLRKETQTPDHQNEHFHLAYLVTPDDIEEYLASFKIDPQKKCSLNTFLFKCQFRSKNKTLTPINNHL